jgi:hypothetical protein
MIKEAIDKILDLGNPVIMSDIIGDGRSFSSKPIHPILDPVVAPICGSTP